MRPIKMLGLAALAALMAMAIIGASSAVAEETALCMEEPPECIAVEHVHETSVGKAKLLSNPTVECNVLFLGDSLGARGNPLLIHGTFTYSSCNNSCTVTEESGPSTIEVLKEGSELSSVTGEGLVKLNCFFGFINCKYNGEGLEGHGLGALSAPSNGSVVIEGQETHVEAGGCPSTAFLDIETTPLLPVYIVKGSDALWFCQKGTTGAELYTDFKCLEDSATKKGNYKLTML